MKSYEYIKNITNAVFENKFIIHQIKSFAKDGWLRFNKL